MDMRSNNRPPRKFPGKPGGRPMGRPTDRGPGQFSERPMGRPAGKPEWRADGGKPEGSRPEGRPNWNADARSAPRPDGKPAWKRDGGFERKPGGRPDGRPNWNAEGKPAGRPDGKPSWKAEGRPSGRPDGRPNWSAEGKPRYERDDRPQRQPEGGFDRNEGKPKWNEKGRPGRTAGKFEGRSNWDPDSRPERKPFDRPMSRPEGKPYRGSEGKPEWNRDDRPARQPDDRPFGRAEGRPDDKPKWSAKGRPAGRPSGKFGGRSNWDADARPERAPKWAPKGQPAEQSEQPSTPSPADKPSHKQKQAGAGAPMPKEQPTHWGNVAEWYDELVGDEGSEYHQEVIIPGLLKMLNLTQDGEQLPRVLDLACGQGVLCRRLAEYGCSATGVDAAEELIEAARKRNEEDKLDIRYVVADVTQLVDDNDQLVPIIEKGSYDVATIVLSIQNITPLTPVWLACREALKPGGHLIVVMMHPCFRIPRKSDWFWNSANSTQSRLVSLYLSSDQIEIQTHPGLAAHGKDESSTTHFHRPLQAYINTLGNAGLLVDHIEEWPSHKTEQPGPKKVAIDRARKEIPMFLALRMRKV